MYTIIKRERTNFLDDMGMAADGYRVYFRMEDGTTDYIEIGKSEFDADAVHAAIESLIARHTPLANF